LPKLIREDQVLEESENSYIPTPSNASFRKKILYSFSKKSRHLRKSNSDRLERYLRDCINDPNIQSCSLFKEFLQPQREEDSAVLKQMVQSYVEQQQQQQDASREIVDCGPTPPPDEAIIADERSFLSYSSFSSRIQPATPQPIPTYSSSSSSSQLKDDMISLSSDEPVTIQDFQLIKVIGRGCMGKVSLHVCSTVWSTKTYILK
jgi:hypothetical protein